MTDYPGWYPPGHPPELPAYLKSVYDLKPITGVPSDEEVIGIHAVIQVANRASAIPGMQDPRLLMELRDHLFSAQMAVYRSKYTSLLFPDGATYTPPILPAHVPVILKPVSGTPSDEQLTRVQEAIRSYQKYSEIPSMFEPGVNAELSQHLFDIQLARHIHRAAQHQPSMKPHVTPHLTSSDTVPVPHKTEEDISCTNNAGTGASVTITGSYQLDDAGIRDVLERSNQLTERANRLSERSNELIERSTQALERNSQLVEKSRLPVEKSDQPAESPNTNNLSERFGDLLGQLNQYFKRSNQLAEGSKTSIKQIGDTLKIINKVLVGIQHTIVRNYTGNTEHTIRSLINEKGDTPMGSSWLWFPDSDSERLCFSVGSGYPSHAIMDDQVVYFLRFYGIEGDFFEDSAKTKLRRDKKAEARGKLGRFLSAALGS